MKRYFAEMLGTAWLVLGGCGAAVLSAAFPQLGIGFAGVALAFGLTVVTMAYAIGPVSGAHLNPAVTFGLWVNGRIPGKDVLPYMGAQVIGGIIGAAILFLIAHGHHGFSPHSGFAANGYASHSPGHYTLISCFIAETAMTYFFLMVILGATDTKAAEGFAPLAIGLCLTLIHLISIPVTNTSVNPARSLGPAVFVGGWAIRQVWLFWLAPLLGAGLAGISYKVFQKK